MALEKKGRFCYDDLNSFLAALRETGDLIEIPEEVDPKFEIGAILGLLGERDGPAALFSQVTGFSGKTIAGNIVGHRRRIALALGVQEDELAATYLERKNSRIPPVLVKEAPVKQVSVRPHEIDLLQILPALTHHEKDASPYLTCAVTFASNPQTGRQSMGMHRIQVQSEKTLGICLGTPPLSHFLQRAWEGNRPLDVAVVIGPDPAVLIASVTRCIGGEDKVEIAGGFRQKAVEMVSCDSVDLRVPAYSQYLIEGTIRPGHLAHEGVFGDSSGTYVEAESPVIQVTSVSHREKPIYQALQTWSSEDDALLNLCFGSDLLEDVRKDHPFIRDLHLVTGTLCGEAIASVRPCSRPMRRSAMIALLTRNPFVKTVILVDEDIDVRNLREVMWALTMRFQADRDLLLLPAVQGSVIDPSSQADGSSCKAGMDATFAPERVSAFQKIKVPAASQKRALQMLENILSRWGGAISAR
jgi:2,5-furandicarboxylate decarboxylase 1